MRLLSRRNSKILFILPRMNSGGAERVVSLLCNQLSASYDITVATLINAPSFYKLSSQVHFLHAPIFINRQTKWHAYWSQFCSFPKALMFVYRLIKREQFVIVFSLLPETDVLVCICKLLGLQFKHICSERNDPSRYNSVYRLILRYIYSHASFFVCQSQKVADYYSCIKPEIKCVIPNPIDLAALPTPVNTPKLRIVSVGRLCPQKNFSLLIDSFAQIAPQFPGYCLDIYGEGPLRPTLQAQINQLGLQDKITLRGRHPQVLKEIADAALFVLPSNFEGFPNALLEALALGLPLISTDFPTGTARELIGAENGLLVPVGDKTALANAMKEILSDPVKQKAMRQANIEKAKEYDVNKIISQWKKALLEIK